MFLSFPNSSFTVRIDKKKNWKCRGSQLVQKSLVWAQWFTYPFSYGFIMPSHWKKAQCYYYTRRMFLLIWFCTNVWEYIILVHVYFFCFLYIQDLSKHGQESTYSGTAFFCLGLRYCAANFPLVAIGGSIDVAIQTWAAAFTHEGTYFKICFLILPMRFMTHKC